MILKDEGDLKKAQSELGRLIARKAEEAAVPAAPTAPAAPPTKKGLLQ